MACLHLTAAGHLLDDVLANCLFDELLFDGLSRSQLPLIQYAF